MSSTRAGEPVLAGRTALVTGASRGIGLACARALAGAGVRVALLARSEETLRSAARGIGRAALPVACDLSRPDSARAAIQEVETAFGGAPDIIVNNAGTFTLAPVEQTSPDSFARTVATNLVAPFTVVHAFLSAMRARRSGHIVTVGSIADRSGLPENGAYAASKFGLRGLHQVLRAELRGSGVRASLVSPGPVDTPLWDPVDPDRRPGFTPRGMMLSPEAVADAVLYVLAQPAEVNVDELRLSRS
jgi:NAD(P)-dependent dehydrogenase (short-subunit alcohol dehydrogenase family)